MAKVNRRECHFMPYSALRTTGLGVAMKDLEIRKSFYESLDKVKQTTAQGVEIWFARDVQPLLGYQRWESFTDVINRARMACASANVEPENHFRDITKKVPIGSGAMAEKGDCVLSRYACYLIAMNGDSGKPEIGLAQTYFAVQARKQELRSEAGNIEKRIELRERVSEAVKELGNAAKEAGVQNYAIFHDAGYRGLYGLNLRAIKARKGIGEKEQLFDRAGRAELAANEFRLTQAEERLKVNNINNHRDACLAHEQVGTEVRKAIERIGGTMPEDLPPEPSIKKLAQQQARQIGKDDSTK